MTTYLCLLRLTHITTISRSASGWLGLCLKLLHRGLIDSCIRSLSVGLGLALRLMLMLMLMLLLRLRIRLYELQQGAEALGP